MSYAQLADMRGISKKAAQRLTLRHRWRRQPANDGGVLVWVPDGAVAPVRQTVRRDGGSDGPDVVALLDDANRRADDAGKRADAALALADRLSGQLAEAGDRADRLERDLASALTAADQARAEARKAQETAEELRKEREVRKARGRLARLRAAWRGE
jgi:hypothetical protein